MIDIGVNLLHPQFDADRTAVIERGFAAGITHFIVTGTNLAESERAIAFCEAQNSSFRCTAGVHPHDAGQLKAGWQDELRTLARAPNVCALGETGLDFFRNFSPRADQEAAFAVQIEIANEFALPLFVHDRDSGGAVATALNAARVPVVVHCFTGSEHDLTTYLDAGYYIGITGWVCDAKRGEELRRLVPQIPLDRLLIETDAPFLRPSNAPVADKTAGKRRNEPALLPYVAEAIADLKSVTVTQIAECTSINAQTLFNLSN